MNHLFPGYRAHLKADLYTYYSYLISKWEVHHVFFIFISRLIALIAYSCDCVSFVVVILKILVTFNTENKRQTSLAGKDVLHSRISLDKNSQSMLSLLKSNMVAKQCPQGKRLKKVRLWCIENVLFQRYNISIL